MIRSIIFAAFFIFVNTLCFAQDQKLTADEAAIKEIIEAESRHFWARDLKKWKKTWVQKPYAVWIAATRDGVRQYDSWKKWLAEVKSLFAESPDPSPYDGVVKKYNFKFRIYGDGAWVSFAQDNHGVITLETRIMEKHKGNWKVAMVQVIANVNEPISTTVN